jgi:hypothetical protein
MKHYETERWVDFARGLLAERERSAMGAHLAAGCNRCRKRAELLSELATLAHAEAEYEPPPQALEQALALYAPPRRSEGLATILARLVYDSMRDPLPAGVRSSDRPSQALYEAGDYLVDLHVNRERSTREQAAPRMVLVGQLGHARDPERRLARTEVVLRAGRRVAARGSCNELGEFHVEYEPGPELTLEIPVAEGRIELPLPRLG